MSDIDAIKKEFCDIDDNDVVKEKQSASFRDRVILNFRDNAIRFNNIINTANLSRPLYEVRDPTDAEIHEITKYVVNVKKRLSKCPVDPGSYWVKQ